MKWFSRTIFLGSAGLLTIGMVIAGNAFAEPIHGCTVRVTIAAPEGIPATVALSGKSTYVAVKNKPGTRTIVTLPVTPGSYKVVADPETIGGRLYLPEVSRPEIPAAGRKPLDLKVTYSLVDAFRDFHASAVSDKSVSLTWTAKPQMTMVVRRTSRFASAKAPDQGVGVPVTKGVAVDDHVTAGARYTYALFGRYHGKWSGPMVVRVGASAPGAASYVANAQTLILSATDFTSAAPTGAGVRVVLGAGQPIPVIGGAVVLPITDALPGGFLGVVTAVSTDGRTVDLTAGGMTDAFDYYELSVPEVHGGDAIPSTAAPTAKLAPQAATASPSSSGVEVPPSERKPLSSTPSAKAGLQALAAPKKDLVSCEGQGKSPEISLDPTLSLDGQFSAKISKYGIFNIPTGATLDMSLTATVAGAMTVSTSGGLSCNLDLDAVVVPIAETPVPISFYYQPTAELKVGGAVKIDSLGVAATAGVKVSGHFGLTDGASFSGSPIVSAGPLTPKITANGTVDAKVGGQVIVGPGAGTSKAGVIAGLGGELNPLDAHFEAAFDSSDPRFNACLSAEAAFTRELNLTAKAWAGDWDVTKSVTVDALTGKTAYPGSPWSLPTGCKDAVDPGDTVLGGGLTKVDDSVSGGPNQLGYEPGFIPGKKTWVLSTGNVADAVGDPATFASTDLGGPGDADLSALSGEPTYDAVSYSATVVPTGPTLHVKYVFASEEYPEFVGSAFNDVMAVYVNGVNCATVPGSNDPVSVNTINAGKNADYYIDNTTGASGLGTTMDGLTKPLECKVPVTVGKPVTVKIAVADSSDRIYDSAVALLDQGIWSD